MPQSLGLDEKLGCNKAQAVALASSIDVAGRIGILGATLVYLDISGNSAAILSSSKPAYIAAIT
jgi:hypothetical protein